MTTTFRARIARTGQQSYPSGPEHRDSSEVFAAASLRTLDGVKVQVSHDPGAPQVGYVRPGSAGRVQGPDGNEFLTAELVITDADTVRAIRAGALKHISCGYNCKHVLRDGVTHQTQIIFDHVAILRAGRETPRCGTHCAVTQDGHNTMTQRYTDAIDGNCTCDAERDRIDAWLDVASDRTGVPRDQIVANHPRGVEVTRDSIQAAAATATRNGGRVTSPNVPAQYVDGTRAGRPAPANGGDAAFRQALAAKDRADGFEVSGTDPNGMAKIQQAGLGESARLERENARQLAAAKRNADDEFRAALKAKG